MPDSPMAVALREAREAFAKRWREWNPAKIDLLWQEEVAPRILRAAEAQLATHREGNPMQFRKKPVVIEAVQFSEHDIGTHAHVCFGYPKAEGDFNPHPMDGKYWVQTLEGPLTVSEGDWIITGVKGEHYPCKPDIFAETYEPA